MTYTKKRFDDKGTEFGSWLRDQPEIDSRLYGFQATNVDYVWYNKRTGEFMFIEEKRHGASIASWQRNIFLMLDKICSEHPNTKYRGFHIIVFENTSPDDGKIFINGLEITKKQLLYFLKNFGL